MIAFTPVVSRISAGTAGAAKAGRLIILLLQLAAILESVQARLHVLELRAVDLIFVARRKQGGDFLLALGHALGSLRVAVERLGDEAGLFLFHGFDFFHERGE